MNRLLVFAVFLLFLAVPLFAEPLPAGESGAGSVSRTGACEFDLYLLNHLRRENVAEVPALLDYIVERAPHVRHELCKENSTQKWLTHKVREFYSKDYIKNHSVPVVHTRYFGFAGEEVGGRVLTEEDNAAYNLILDFIVAKYDMLFALAKKTDLMKKSKLSTGAFVEYMFTYLVTPSAVVDAAEEVVKSPQAMAVDAAASWASLWIQKESPYERDAYYDFDYSWLLIAKDNFLERYPDSRYRAALNAMISKDVVTELHEADKESGVLGLGIGLSVGKSVRSSALDAVDETFTFSVPNARIQVLRFVFQLQVDMLVGDGISAAGLDAMIGPTFEFDEYAFDVLAGIGFDEFFVGEDSIMCLAFMGGVQAMRRLPLGDMANIVPKLQWIVKTLKFDDPVKNRKRRAFINQFSIGISFEARQPLSRLNAF